MAPDLRERPGVQAAWLLGGLALWALIYVLWVHWLSGISVEGPFWERVVFALQSTVYIAFPVVLLLPLMLVRMRRPVLAVGILLAAGLLALHLVLPKDTLLYDLSRDLALLLFAVLLGAVVGWGVGENRHILPAFVVLFVVDVWSVFWGISMRIAERPGVTEHALIGSPVAGRPGMPVIRPLLGPADVLILAAAIALSVKFRLGVVRTLLYLAGGILVGFLFVAFLGRPLPMLPFIVTAFVIAHIRRLDLDWKQVITAAVFSLALVAVLTVASLAMNRPAPPG